MSAVENPLSMKFKIPVASHPEMVKVSFTAEASEADVKTDCFLFLCIQG